MRVCGGGGEGWGREENQPMMLSQPVLPRVTVFPESPVPSWVGPSHISHGCPLSLSELLFQRQSVLNQVLCFGRGMEPSFLILLLWESVFWVPNNSTYKYIFGIWPSYIYTPRTACSRVKILPCTASRYQLQAFLILILFEEYHIKCLHLERVQTLFQEALATGLAAPIGWDLKVQRTPISPLMLSAWSCQTVWNHQCQQNQSIGHNCFWNLVLF